MMKKFKMIKMFETDEPIKEFKDDKLNRTEFAKTFGNAINSYKNEDCLVIGLMGEWGSGKTSLINLCLKQIEDKIIIHFNPWIFSEENNLIWKFFNALIQSLDEIDLNKEYENSEENNAQNNSFYKKLNEINIIKKYNNKKTINKLKNKLKKFFNKSITSANLSYSDGLRQISVGGSFSPNWEDEINEEELFDLKKSINEDLNELSTKIIVIIDNIDRLSDSEVKQIFKLVKSIADFKNLIYILSFDRNMVIKSLENIQIYSPEKYLEKIIQIPIQMPKVEELSLYSYFEWELAKIHISDQFSITFDENGEFIEILNNLTYFINNLRDVKRFINTLKFFSNILEGELNTNDYLLIIALQIFENKIYHNIKNNKDFFTSLKENYSSEDKNEDKKLLDELLKDKEQLNDKELYSIISKLFPKFNFLVKKIQPSTDYNNQWKKESRICDSETFEKYFSLTIPKNEISKRDLMSIIKSEDSKFLYDKILELNKNGKTKQFLSDVINNIGEIPSENIPLMIETLLNIGDLLTIQEQSFLHIDVGIYISRIIDDLLFRYETQEQRYEILKEIIPKLDKSIHTLTHVIGIEDQSHGKYGFAEKPRTSEDLQLINDMQLDNLEKLTAEKIKEWANSGKLINCSNLNEILYDWSLWENINIVKEFVEENLKDDQNIIKLIQGFEKNINTLKNYNIEHHKTYDFKILERFINLSELEIYVKTLQQKQINPEIINHFLKELYEYIKNNDKI